MRHRGIGDLMRCAALNQDLDLLADYGGFVPDLALLASVPEQDAPPASPHALDELALRDQAVFDGEGCASCHTPPAPPQGHRHGTDVDAHDAPWHGFLQGPVFARRVVSRAVRAQRVGLELDAEDRAALIAFLRTL